MTELSKLTPVNPREVWAHEEYNFTPWLLDHADELADALGIELELTANEYPVGTFSLDLLGRDLTHDCTLIVENQLEGTDHNHLGQLVTYAAGTDAGTVVWIATSFREEHRQALDYLNELSGDNARFFGVVVGAVRIDDSRPAALFTVKAQPNDWFAQVAAPTRQTAERGGKAVMYTEFWTKYLKVFQDRYPGWSAVRSPGYKGWSGAPSGFKGGGNRYNAVFKAGDRVAFELYLDAGDADANTQLFEHLHAHRAEVEAAFGATLVWEPLPERRACRIYVDRDGSVDREEEHEAYIGWLVDVAGRFRDALEAHAPD